MSILDKACTFNRFYFNMFKADWFTIVLLDRINVFFKVPSSPHYYFISLIFRRVNLSILLYYYRQLLIVLIISFDLLSSFSSVFFCFKFLLLRLISPCLYKDGEWFVADLHRVVKADFALLFSFFLFCISSNYWITPEIGLILYGLTYFFGLLHKTFMKNLAYSLFLLIFWSLGLCLDLSNALLTLSAKGRKV